MSLLKASTMRTIALATFALGALLSGPVLAQTAKPGEGQAVVPQVDRRDVRLPRIPSRDFEVGLFAGTYGTQNFGSSAVLGLRLGYHITEDFFVEGAFASTKVKDDSFRQILPGGIFAGGTETLRYYNLSAGYNLLPGEVFFGANRAKASSFFLLGGVGSTNFNDQSRQTINLGFGMRLLLGDRSAVRVDVRDHIYSLDLLGKRESTQNLEVTAGFSLFF